MVSNICLWSGPRNVSTALMYSFAERTDTRVIDEPLYGHYLRVSGAMHPGRDEVLDAMDCDGERVMQALLNEPADRPVRFMKHMAHHLTGMSDAFLAETHNVLLIRDPRDMLPSLTKQLPDATLADTGLAKQVALIDTLQQRGQAFWVLDSRQLLINPKAVLSQLCDALGIGFDNAMLSWRTGPRDEDGVWAPHWYHAVHNSTGFAPYHAKRDFPEALERLLEECAPCYDQLFKHALRAPQPPAKEPCA